MNLKTRLKPFKHPYFIITLFFVAIMLLIISQGNPYSVYGAFYWHYIPEMIALFFLGMLLSAKGLKPIGLLLILGVTAPIAFLAVAIPLLNSLSITNAVMSLAHLAVVISPLAIGFYVERRHAYS